MNRVNPNPVNPPKASRREFWLFTGVLALGGVLLYGPSILHGGFFIDDWPHAVEVAYAPHPFADEWAGSAGRPVQVLYYPITSMVFGPHPWVHHLWSVFAAVCLSSSLYAVLRRFDIGTYPAAAIAILLLLFPWSDSTKFWVAGSVINIAVALGLGGVVLALRGLDCQAKGGSVFGRWWHVGALSLYALSVLTYEVAAVALLLVGGLYLMRVGAIRAAVLRWVADVVVIGTCLVWGAENVTRERLPLSQALHHIGELVDGAISVIALAALPIALDRTLVLVILLTIITLALVTLRFFPIDETARALLRHWLTMAGIGLVIAIAGWAIIIPANAYNPAEPGLGNRINVAAAVGIAIMVYAIAVLLAILLISVGRRFGKGLVLDRRSLGALSGLLVAAIGVGYANRTLADQRVWNHATRDSSHVLDMVKRAVPNPPPETTIYTFNYPGSEGPGIPIFSFMWDLNNAVKLHFQDQSVSAYPMVVGFNAMICKRYSMGPVGSGWSVRAQGAEYGHGVFVDIATGNRQRISSPKKCRAALKRFVPGPWVR